VTPYRPAGGFTSSGVLMLIGALLVAGGVLGFVVHLVSQAFYLIILFPALIGAALGWLGSRMVKQGRVRSPLLGGLAGFLGGVLAMFMMHYFDYQQFRKNLASELAQMTPQEREEKLGHINPADRQNVDAVMKAGGREGMLGFMDYQAEQGVELKKASSSGKGLNLGYTGSYVYWGIEVLIVAGISFGMIRGAASEPYCSACDEWKKPRVLGFLGADPATATAAVQSGDLQRFRNAGPSATGGPTRVTVASCETGQGRCGVDVKLESIAVDKHGKQQTKKLAHATYPPEALPHLAAVFQPGPAVGAAVTPAPPPAPR
jgi:hypothetical protein